MGLAPWPMVPASDVLPDHQASLIPGMKAGEATSRERAQAGDVRQGDSLVYRLRHSSGWASGFLVFSGLPVTLFPDLPSQLNASLRPTTQSEEGEVVQDDPS